MEHEGIVHNGVIVPDDSASLAEGTRVRIDPVPPKPVPSFGERYAAFCGAIDASDDLALQHEYYRLGVLK